MIGVTRIKGNKGMPFMQSLVDCRKLGKETVDVPKWKSKGQRLETVGRAQYPRTAPNHKQEDTRRKTIGEEIRKNIWSNYHRAFPKLITKPQTQAVRAASDGVNAKTPHLGVLYSNSRKSNYLSQAYSLPTKECHLIKTDLGRRGWVGCLRGEKQPN